MSKPISFGRLDFELVASMDEPQGVPEPETPFRILLLGDFSGRANRDLFETGSGLSTRAPVLVDRDDIEKVLAHMGVELHLSAAAGDTPPVALGFTELEDFNPDQIFDRVDVFRSLKETRRKLFDEDTFASTAAEMGALPDKQPAPEPEQAAAVELDLAKLTSGSLLDQVLDETQGDQPAQRASPQQSEWGAFLQEIVRPHLVPKPDPKQAELVEAVDSSITDLMRRILHQADFQAIESAWRAVHFLVSRLETDAQLKLYLFDISKAELAADLSSAEDLRSTWIYRLLVEQTVESPGAEPWSVVAGNYSFSPSPEDAELLGRMARIAKQAGAPFIAAGGAGLLGCESLAETADPEDWRPPTEEPGMQAWQALRELPEAAYLGLAMPRFLLRLPYGEDTEPVERFDFEEMTAEFQHEGYLWGNPCFACVYLLAQAFTQSGWDLHPGAIQDIEALPLHVYRVQGESRIKPCAEVVLTERAAEKILGTGIMPFLSIRNQDSIRLARFQSLADPLTQVKGPWQ